jgi:uncharacterized integral membrane protein
MQFLKALFWVVFGVTVALFARVNWHDATLKLWGGLAADVKLPVLLLAFFLLGWLPTLIVYRARLWALKRRYEPVERNLALSSVAAPATPVSNNAGPETDRLATDSKVWPA